MTEHERILWYATYLRYRHRFSVIPMSIDSKVPMGKWKEFQERRPSLQEIARWPDPCNFAIITGEISGIVVVDCDSYDNAVWWWNKTKDYGNPAIVRSRRGAHFYYRHPGEYVKCGAHFEDGKYDIRGDRGYVLSPPSVHNDGRYLWKRKITDVSSLPLFKTEWRPDIRRNYQHANGDDEAIVDVESLIKGIYAYEGQGAHNAAFRVACRLKDAGHDSLQAFAAMKRWNKTNAFGKDGGLFPFSDYELEHKIRSVYR